MSLVVCECANQVPLPVLHIILRFRPHGQFWADLRCYWPLHFLFGVLLSLFLGLKRSASQSLFLVLLTVASISLEECVEWLALVLCCGASPSVFGATSASLH